MASSKIPGNQQLGFLTRDVPKVTKKNLAGAAVAAQNGVNHLYRLIRLEHQRAEPNSRRAGQTNVERFAQGIRATETDASRAARRVAEATQNGFLGGITTFASLGRATGSGTLPSAGPNGTGSLAAPGAGTGDAPGEMTGGPAFRGGYLFGTKAGAAAAAGMGAGYGANMSMNLNLPSGAGGAGVAGGEGGNWGGTLPVVEGLAASTGLPVVSRKRSTRNTRSGNVSDHFIGNPTAYATDLGVTDRRIGDPIAMRLAQALGTTWAPGSWTSANSNGFRWQLGWQVPQHFDHIHLGARKLHGGGTFSAPSRGGEGLALLRDRERVLPASGTPRAGSGPTTIGPISVTIHSGSTTDPRALAQQVAAELAKEIDSQLGNLSLESTLG